MAESRIHHLHKTLDSADFIQYIGTIYFLLLI